MHNIYSPIYSDCPRCGGQLERRSPIIRDGGLEVWDCLRCGMGWWQPLTYIPRDAFALGGLQWALLLALCVLPVLFALACCLQLSQWLR